MTDPRTEAEKLRDLLWNRQMPDRATMTVTLGELRAAFREDDAKAEAAAGPRRGHPCNSLCDQSQDLHYIAVQMPAAEASES